MFDIYHSNSVKILLIHLYSLRVKLPVWTVSKDSRLKRLKYLGKGQNEDPNFCEISDLSWPIYSYKKPKQITAVVTERQQWRRRRQERKQRQLRHISSSSSSNNHSHQTMVIISNSIVIIKPLDKSAVSNIKNISTMMARMGSIKRCRSDAVTHLVEKTCTNLSAKSLETGSCLWYRNISKPLRSTRMYLTLRLNIFFMTYVLIFFMTYVLVWSFG